MRKYKLLTVLVAMLISTIALAAPDYATSHCPPANKLVRKGMWWAAPGDWRSYSRSFIQNVTSFIGAQWVGVNVGTIICLYQGDKTSDFPVTIQRTMIVPKPDKGQWIVDKKTGRLNCYSDQVTDCPFSVPKRKNEDVQNAFKTLRSYKKSFSTQGNNN